MSDRHRIAALLLILVSGGLLLALDLQALAAQRPQTTEPPIAPPRGIPGVRDVPSAPPGVRDVPAPATPPRVRISPAPSTIEAPVGDGTYCPVDPPAPVVSIKVRVPARAAADVELEYRLCVENHGKAPAHHVVVRNPLPVNATFVRADPPPTASDPILEWRLGTLEGCARREIVLVLKPTGTGDVKNCARVQFEHGECVVTKIGAPPPLPALGQGRLQVRKTGPAQAILHNPIGFQLVVTNAGTAAVQGVELTDTMPDGMEDASKRPKITEALVRKGYSDEDIRKILGGNLLRVLAANERVARDLKK